MSDRAPSFRFHAADWLADLHTRRMGAFARGVYIDLLAVQWREGYVPDDSEEVAIICGIRPAELDFFHAAWPAVRARFEPRDAPDGENLGILVNRRLEAEREKLERFIERQRKAGRKGGKRAAANRKRSKKIPRGASSDPSSDPSGEPEARAGGEASKPPAPFGSMGGAQTRAGTREEPRPLAEILGEFETDGSGPATRVPFPKPQRRH